MTWPRRATYGLWAASAALLVLAFLAVRDQGDPADAWVVGGSILCSAIPFTAGHLVTRHDPSNWVGPWLTAAGANIILQMAHGTWAEALADAPSGLAASAELLNLTQGIWMGWFLPFAMVLLLFPDGRPADTWGRRTAIALPALVVAFNLLLAIAPGPLTPPLPDWPRPFGTHWIGYASIPVLIAFYAALVAAALSTRRRYRAAATDLQRSRLRWMFLSCLSVPATILLCWAGYLLTGTPIFALGGLVAMNVAIPTATLIAMLRHDLYDVDRALVATAAYSTLAFGVVASYGVLSAVIGRALGGDSATAAVISTVIVMIALLPARSILLRVLGRRLHPRRECGVAAVRSLVAAVHAGADQPERLEEVLRQVLRDPGLRVGYQRPGSTDFVDVDQRSVPAEGSIPITLARNVVGVIRAGDGAAGIPEEVAREAGLLAESVRLRGELSEALSAVEASRRRLLSAGYEERRRLEMDLHDGAQQRLVSLGMRLRVAQHRADGGDAPNLDALVDGAVGELALAVAELRQIAHGLRPSCLDDGLAPALESLTRSCALPLDITCSADELPDHVSLTAYYVASEGVANAVKHATASRVAVHVRQEESIVHVAVRDDGRGGHASHPAQGWRCSAIGSTPWVAG